LPARSALSVTSRTFSPDENVTRRRRDPTGARDRTEALRALARRAVMLRAAPRGRAVMGGQ
jgi:hypothetical protein